MPGLTRHPAFLLGHSLIYTWRWQPAPLSSPSGQAAVAWPARKCRFPVASLSSPCCVEGASSWPGCRAPVASPARGRRLAGALARNHPHDTVNFDCRVDSGLS